MILAAIRSLILADSTTSNLIGGRVYPYTIDFDTPKPAVAIRLLPSNLMSQTLVGQRNVRANVVTVDCFSLDDWSLSDTIAMRIQAPPILGYRGTVDGVFIQGISTDGSLLHEVEGIEPASKKRICVTTVDFDVIWSVSEIP